MLIVDAHLDLAYNVDRGRDVTRPASEQPATDGDIATVGLPDLRAGNVGLICATIFCSPWRYKTAQDARGLALNQMKWYQKQVEEKRLRLVTTASKLPRARESLLPAILLMEGADSLRSVEDVDEWFAAGLRIVGLAWQRTRAAGGTGEPGPLTEFGRELVRKFDQLGIVHDTSHLADESFWQLMELANGPVMASHSNCRAIVPTDRQLSDEMIAAIAKRGGVIGINFYDQFLMKPSEYRTRKCTLADLIAHVKHMTDVIGSASNIGLGSDMDGGLGREEIPCELSTAADLPKMADAFSDAGFADAAVRGLMGENWLSFFRRSLPGGG